MSLRVGVAIETEGRSASPTRVVEGGRYVGIPLNRTEATTAAWPTPPQRAAGRLRRDTAGGREQSTQPSLFSVSHFRGSLHFLPRAAAANGGVELDPSSAARAWRFNGVRGFRGAVSSGETGTKA